MGIEELTSGGTVLPITRWGEPVMHAQTRPVTAFDDDLRQLVRDMFATMAAAHGVGLAATQVGIDLALFIYDCPDEDEKVERSWAGLLIFRESCSCSSSCSCSCACSLCV